MASDFSRTTVKARSSGAVHSKLWEKINFNLEFQALVMQGLKSLLSKLMPWRVYAIKTEYKPKQKTWDVGNQWKEDEEG